jgi:hypothetical protein
VAGICVFALSAIVAGQNTQPQSRPTTEGAQGRKDNHKQFELMAAGTVAAQSSQPVSQNASATYAIATPSAAEQSKAMMKVSQVFGIADLKQPEQMSEAAKQMLETAKTTSDASNLYALLRTAINLSAKAGDHKTAFEALEMLNKTFNVGEEIVRYQSQILAGTKELTPQLATQLEEMINTAMSREDFIPAVQLSIHFVRLASSGRDKSYAFRATELLKIVREMDGEIKKVKSAENILA